MDARKRWFGSVEKEPEPEVKAEPKDGKWNNDSVFLPVRTDKK